ncbi:MAG TPA: hypothetical protein ENN38_03195 [Actinobacteria bacterium]|nr:hypothetical protein [Actinomycetota bacterium]
MMVEMEQRKKDRRQKGMDIFIDRRTGPRRINDGPYTIQTSPILRKKRTLIFAGILVVFLLLNVLDLLLTARGVAKGILESSAIILTLGGLSFTQAAVVKFFVAMFGALILFKFRYFWTVFFIALFVTLFYAATIIHQFLFQFFLAGFKL